MRKSLLFLLIALCAGAWAQTRAAEEKPMSVVTDKTLQGLSAELTAKYGEASRPRVEKGLRQASAMWRAEDGSEAEFAQFARDNFVADPAQRDVLFARFESLLEQLNGNMQEISREFRSQNDLNRGPIESYDSIFAGWDPSAHVIDDMFANKLAFVVLLNFPLSTLDERLANGDKWSRRQWAETRLAAIFSARTPASVNQAIAAAGSEADEYIAQYNIWMHHLVDDKGERLFPAKMRLLSHWNLRDELKSDYVDSAHGLAKQRMIAAVMARIIDQTIPQAVIDNPAYDWNPRTNVVKPTSEHDGAGRELSGDIAAREPDTRYAKLLGTYRAARLADPYAPVDKTMIDRKFNQERELPEARVRAMLVKALTAPEFARTGRLIAKRLGRPLEPFDIWYNGFRAHSSHSEAELDKIVARKYPTAEAYRRDIPRLLRDLDFAPETADYVAANIDVDPARGSGHAMGASMRSAHAHLRTRVEADGMNYKGYNIAVHEMGHNVEQTLSLNKIDHYLLHGVPNTAFTEALAFVFQARDLKLLGLEVADPQGEALSTLNDYWGACEIAGVALVDIDVWRWMYAHPEATPAELREAVLRIAREVWNQYYAPVFGARDVTLLAVYSHMIDSFMYLPDYPVGHFIAFQIEEQIRKAGKVGPEFARMVSAGSISPDLWMIKATGRPVGPEAMLEATDRALGELEK